MRLAAINFLRRKMKPKRPNLTRPYERREKRGLNPEQPVRRSGKLGRLWLANPFFLQARFGDLNYAQLNQVWSSLDNFLDLSKSSSDAARFYQAQEGYATEKLFLSQYGASKRPLLLNEQMS